MDYPKTKIYNDGSHYIGIPQGAYPSGKGCKRRAVKQVQQPKAIESLNTFETAYKESLSLPKRERKSHIKAALKTDFADYDELTAFVNKHVEQKKTNALKRRTRLMRKLRLQQWDYFCTFTYSDELHKLDRFSRNQFETVTHKKTLKDNGVKLISAMENIPDTPEGIILESLLEGFEHTNGHNNKIRIKVAIQCKLLTIKSISKVFIL